MIGHIAQKEYLERSREAGSLAHCYALVGPDGVGKRTLAHEVAAPLLGVDVLKVPLQPNYIYISRLEDEKTGKLKKEISVAQARELKATLSGSVWGGGNRVVVIDEAELLNAEASNALLKILEEPPKNTYFFLLTNNDDLLLPTIKSRVQSIYLAPVPDEQMRAGLRGTATNENEIEEVVALAWGRPGRAVELLRDEQKRVWYRDEIKRWRDLQAAPLYKKISLVENLYGDKDDAVRGREVLRDVLELWMMQARESLAAHPTIIDDIMLGRELLSKNIHPRLILENILVKI